MVASEHKQLFLLTFGWLVGSAVIIVIYFALSELGCSHDLIGVALIVHCILLGGLLLSFTCMILEYVLRKRIGGVYKFVRGMIFPLYVVLELLGLLYCFVVYMVMQLGGLGGDCQVHSGLGLTSLLISLFGNNMWPLYYVIFYRCCFKDDSYHQPLLSSPSVVIVYS